MNIQKRALTDNIFLLTFPDQHAITSTFLRFQEHYESPEFRGKIFSLKEYKAWYASVKGSFSYYTDWNGFNIPSSILDPFYAGKFDPLSEKEKLFLDMFRDIGQDFYIIGIHEGMKNVASLLNHEIAHGLFHTDQEYRRSVLDFLAQYDLEAIKKELGSMAGYHPDVHDDEINSYAIDQDNSLKTPLPRQLRFSLQTHYRKAIQQYNMKI